MGLTTLYFLTKISPNCRPWGWCWPPAFAMTIVPTAKETKYKENGIIAIDLFREDDDGADRRRNTMMRTIMLRATGRVLLGRKGAGIVILIENSIL